MSQALAALEENLGVQLVVRQRHGVELTAFGEHALEHARAALAHLEAIRRAAAEASGQETGALRLAAFPSVFATVLPPLLRRFRSLYPDIDLVALETDDREVGIWLESGAVDLGVVLNPSPGDAAVRIGADEWLGVLPAAHRLGPAARSLSSNWCASLSCRHRRMPPPCARPRRGRRPVLGGCAHGSARLDQRHCPGSRRRWRQSGAGLDLAGKTQRTAARAFRAGALPTFRVDACARAHALARRRSFAGHRAPACAAGINLPISGVSERASRKRAGSRLAKRQDRRGAGRRSSIA